MPGLTKKEWQVKHGLSDEFMFFLDNMIKSFKANPNKYIKIWDKTERKWRDETTTYTKTKVTNTIKPIKRNVQESRAISKQILQSKKLSSWLDYQSKRHPGIP